MLCSYQRREARFFCLNDLSQRATRVPVFFVAIMVRSPCKIGIAPSTLADLLRFTAAQSDAGHKKARGGTRHRRIQNRFRRRPDARRNKERNLRQHTAVTKGTK
jgi:hypothetical protein